MTALAQDELVELLRARGLRVTAQRLDVYRAMVEYDGHPTPEEVLHAVRRRQPSISLNTVYTTLETLVAAGAIQRGDVAAGPLRYDVKLEPHHHAVCRGCGLQADVRCEPNEPPCHAPPAISGFTVTDTHVTHFGMCAACQAQSAAVSASTKAT